MKESLEDLPEARLTLQALLPAGWGACPTPDGGRTLVTEMDTELRKGGAVSTIKTFLHNFHVNLLPWSYSEYKNACKCI